MLTSVNGASVHSVSDDNDADRDGRAEIDQEWQ